MYKAGYDPLAFLDFLERIESLEKKKPGAIAKVFSTHPLTEDRIKRAQKEIQNDLEPRPEYILDTSEFHEAKARLAMLEGGRKHEVDDNRPTLRRRTPAPNSSGDDERPTLKRRPD
jgi:predicted Zn-dependent protease